MACKPDFVPGLPPSMTIPLAPPLLTGSSCQPGPSGAKAALPCGARSLFGIAPGGACLAGPVTSPAVGSYPTVSPLPMQAWAVCSLWRFPWGYPRRALPGTVPSWSPDFPRRLLAAVIRPSAQAPDTRAGSRGQAGSGSVVRRILPSRVRSAAMSPRSSPAAHRHARPPLAPWRSARIRHAAARSGNRGA